MLLASTSSSSELSIFSFYFWCLLRVSTSLGVLSLCPLEEEEEQNQEIHATRERSKAKTLPSLYEKCEEGIDFLRAFTVLQKANKSSSTKLKWKLSKREKKYLTRKSNMSTRSDCFLLPFEVFWKNKWILLEELEEIFGKQKTEPMTYSTIRYLKNNQVCHESRSLRNFLLKVRCMNNCKSQFWFFS